VYRPLERALETNKNVRLSLVDERYVCGVGDVGGAGEGVRGWPAVPINAAVTSRAGAVCALSAKERVVFFPHEKIREVQSADAFHLLS